jgi:hypothetical protein
MQSFDGDRNHASSVPTRGERANQRNGPCRFPRMDARRVDFFVLTFVVQDVATAFGKTRPTSC